MGRCETAATCTMDVGDGACVDRHEPCSLRHVRQCVRVHQVCVNGECFDHEPAAGCSSCRACDACPQDEPCRDLPALA
jgi:hypothetical protein